MLASFLKPLGPSGVRVVGVLLFILVECLKRHPIAAPAKLGGLDSRLLKHDSDVVEVVNHGSYYGKNNKRVIRSPWGIFTMLIRVEVKKQVIRPLRQAHHDVNVLDGRPASDESASLALDLVGNCCSEFAELILEFRRIDIPLVLPLVHHSLLNRGYHYSDPGTSYFHDENKRDRKTKQVIFSVKAGHVQSAYVRDLRGVIEREDAQIGVLICMEAPTKPMLKEAAEAGFYKPPGLEDRYPRIQILTIEELLAGKGVAYSRLLEVTFKKAPKARKATEEQMPLGGTEIDEPF